MFKLTCQYCGSCNNYIGDYEPEIKTFCNICKKEINPVILQVPNNKEHNMKDAAIVVLIVIIGWMYYLIHTDKDNVQIIKDGSTYEVYKNNELLHEFTTQNTDTASLETLEMIISP